MARVAGRRYVGPMPRRFLLLLFVALAILGRHLPASDVAVAATFAVADAEEHDHHDDDDEACCPCDEGCTATQCACVAFAAAVLPARLGAPDPRTFIELSSWTLGSEQRALDRSSTPPTRPPIG